MDQVPFCERNTKMWVTALVVSGILVLAYSGWLAWERGHFSGFGGKHGPVSAATAPIPPGIPLQQAPPATPPNPGQLVAMPMPAQRHTPIDGITHATPHGGVRFIGGPQPPHVQTAMNHAADVIRPSVVNVSASLAGFPMGGPATQYGARFIQPFDGTPDKIIGQAAYENVGSGLIIDAAGYVVTNAHVLSGSANVVVSLYHHPNDHLVAEVIVSDPALDLALLHISGQAGLPAATLADSSLVEVGDRVLAVGNPFGLEHTVTSGIISAKRSQLLVEGVQYHDLLQTDASINRGSSGGPLVDMNGQVIGINTAIWAPNGTFSGAGFTIPSNQVRAFVAKAARGLMSAGGGGTTPHPGIGGYVGIGVIDVNVALATKLSYPHSGGAFVSSVVRDSPADKAQIMRGDIITSLAGQPIYSTETLSQLLAAYGPGHSVPLTIWRDGKTLRRRMAIAAGRKVGP